MARSTWATRTRESVARLLLAEGIPLTAEYAHENLDITTYGSGIGFIDRRTRQEASSAFVWLKAQGYAEEVDREEDDVPGGKLYVLTAAGRDFARTVRDNPTPRHAVGR